MDHRSVLILLISGESEDKVIIKYYYFEENGAINEIMQIVLSSLRADQDLEAINVGAWHECSGSGILELVVSCH